MQPPHFLGVHAYPARFRVHPRMPGLVQMQRHIRNYGSVVTRLDIWSDLKPFFKTNPGGVFPGHGEAALHAATHFTHMSCAPLMRVRMVSP